MIGLKQNFELMGPGENVGGELVPAARRRRQRGVRQRPRGRSGSLSFVRKFRHEFLSLT